MDQWSRECQECGYIQLDKEPVYGSVTDSYLNKQCRKCHSTALEYGRFRDTAKELDESRNNLLRRLTS